MKAIEAMICWNPGSHEVDAVPWPDTGHASARYRMTTGACLREWRDAKPLVREMLVFIEFNTLVVRDWVDPMAAHRAFLKIDEYRERLAPDTPGATP